MDLYSKKMGPKRETEHLKTLGKAGTGEALGCLGGDNFWGSVLRTAIQGETAPTESLCFKFRFVSWGRISLSESGHCLIALPPESPVIGEEWSPKRTWGAVSSRRQGEGSEKLLI